VFIYCLVIATSVPLIFTAIVGIIFAFVIGIIFIIAIAIMLIAGGNNVYLTRRFFFNYIGCRRG
jgi:uncharacterized membrane-anchored protein